MAKLTTAQLREKDVFRLAKMGEENGTPTEQAIEKARYLMNSYYRLCGLCETNLYLSNDSRTCNTTRTARSEEREMKWYRRLKAEFEQFCGLTLNYGGYFPSICRVNEHGGCYDVMYPHFYK